MLVVLHVIILAPRILSCATLVFKAVLFFHHHHHHHHHISVMELGHLLTRSGLKYPEVSSKVCHGSFCQLGNIVMRLASG